LENFFVGVGIGQGWDSPVGGAGAEANYDLALLAHFMGYLEVLLVANASADDAHLGFRDFDALAVSQLPEILVVHEYRNMHEVNQLEHLQQSFPQVHHGDFTS